MCITEKKSEQLILKCCFPWQEIKAGQIFTRVSFSTHKLKLSSDKVGVVCVLVALSQASRPPPFFFCLLFFSILNISWLFNNLEVIRYALQLPTHG